MALERITDANYNEFVQAEIAVLIFSGDWCSDCKTFIPEVEMVAQEHREARSEIRFGKVDVSRSREPTPANIVEIMGDYPEGIGEIPRVEIYRRGQRVFAEAPTTAENLNGDYLRRVIKPYVAP